MAHLALIGLIDLQLFLAVAVLFSVGFLVSRLSGPLWFSRGLSPAHLVAVGQLVVVLDFYLRSFSNHLIGRVMPITALDVVVLLAVLVLAVHWKEGLEQAGRALWQARVELTLFACLVATLCFIIAWNELPRVTMLHSDADQHAFWARQVERFRTLPYFHQFWWGDVGFEYPGGFAILNYVWMVLSGLDAREIVSVQTLLQVQIAILVLSETIRPDEPESPSRTGAALGLCFLAYYQLLPYGYEDVHYSQVMTGRTASMLFAALPLDLLLFALGDRRDDLARRDLPLAPQAQLLGLSALVAGWINIVNLPYLLAISAGGLIALWARRSRRGGLAALHLFAPLPLILIDPYYMKRLLFHGMGRALAAQPASLLPFSALRARWGEAVLLSLGEPLRFVGDFFRTDLLNTIGTVVVWAMLSTSVLALCQRWRRRTAVSLGIALALLFATRALVFPLTVALNHFGPDFFLLSEYIDTSRQQLVILIWYACIVLLTIELARRLSPIGIFMLVLAILLFSRVAPNTQIGPYHRQIYLDHVQGWATEGDLTVIRHAELLFRSWRREHPVMDFTSVPRILIPNAVVYFSISRENWLFPYGGARILPLANVFPVAFFYFEGSRDYTFEAYRDHVCNRFDVDWLLARNIRYLFLPAQRGLSCIANLDSVIASARILANDENAQLLEISSQPLR